jgi:hypothetical protein
MNLTTASYKNKQYYTIEPRYSLTIFATGTTFSSTLMTRPRADEGGKSELVAVTSWEPLIGSNALCQALHLPSSPTPPR